MADRKGIVQLDGLSGLLFALIAGIVLMLAPAVFFAVKGDPVGFAVSVAVIAMIFLGLLVMGAVAVGAAYTRSTMRDGAGIALQAQDFNDRWDTAKMGHMSKIFTEGARTAKSIREPDIPALPMPSQGGLEWMPPIAMLEGGDNGDWEVE